LLDHADMLDEAERSMHDALCILSQTVKVRIAIWLWLVPVILVEAHTSLTRFDVAQSKSTVLGGGCSEMLMSEAVDELVKITPGKEVLTL